MCPYLSYTMKNVSKQNQFYVLITISTTVENVWLKQLCSLKQNNKQSRDICMEVSIVLISSMTINYVRLFQRSHKPSENLKRLFLRPKRWQYSSSPYEFSDATVVLFLSM